MGGASVSLIKLDEELQHWLDHPCDTPALRVGAAAEPPVSTGRRLPRAQMQKVVRAPVERSKLATGGAVTPAFFRTMMAAAAQAIFDQRDHLCELDGAAGDGDHGVTMEIGWKAALAAIDQGDSEATISELCETVADAFLNAVGASVGPLYASAFTTAGAAVSDRMNLDNAALVVWLNGMSQGIIARGGAAVGDKTMVDAWLPAVQHAARALDAGSSAADCLAAAAKAATMGAETTTEMQSNRGRSKKLGARSVGHKDPGATSAAIMITAWADVVRKI